MPPSRPMREHRKRYHFFLLMYREWGRYGIPRLAAALSFYTLFSLAPLLFLVIVVAGFIIDPTLVERRILLQLQGLLGENTARFIETLITNARAQTSGTLLVVGVGLLVWTATNVFMQTKAVLNTIWDIEVRPPNGLLHFLVQRFFALLFVLGIGFVLAVILIVNILLETLLILLAHAMPLERPLSMLWQFLLSYGLITFTFTIMYRIFPDIVIRWREALVGALVGGTFFYLAQYLIAWYLRTIAPASIYGAAGALVVLLLWLYYSHQIFLLGALVTKVYVRLYHRPTRLKPNARQIMHITRPRLP
nr:YihY/virulence factor BrkB family protein [Ardenticatena sp.]